MLYKKLEKVFSFLIKSITFFSMIVLIFIIGFLLKESLVIFQDISLHHFIFGREWRPTSVNVRIGLLPMILGSIVLSFLSLIIALPLAIGTSFFVSLICPTKYRRFLRSLIDLMAGIPSVIYGFIGMIVLLPLIEKIFNRTSGDSLLAGAILLSVMILPFMVSTIVESMESSIARNALASNALGVSRWFMLRNLILPSCKTGIFAGSILGTSRAMGETMAVIMVVGNSALMPTSLFQRIKPLTSLIAMEIGSAPIGSLHYHALFGAGFVLLILLLIINLFFYYLKNKLEY